MNLNPSESNPRSRPKPFTFYPPKNNKFLIGLMQFFIRGIIRRKLKVTEVEIDDASLGRLQKLKGQRCLLLPSHSGGFEPHILMYLGKLLGEQFNFVAAMELFEQSRMYRWLMPRLGVYSIIRGAIDRPSFSMTRKLLAAGDRWLVIFPEGQTIWQNSMVIPFQQGVLQLAFKGYQDACKTDAEAHLYCVPIAVKYVYLQNMEGEIDASLARLEEKLSLAEGAARLSRYERLQRIGKAVLIANEKAQKVAADETAEFNDRILALKEHMVSRIERLLEVTPPLGEPLIDRIRALFNALDRITQEEPEGSEYEQQLAEERQQLAQGLYEDVWRLLQFVSIEDGYVRQSMTAERFLDMLCLLEMEVFKTRRMWGPRKARVRVGEPTDLKDQTEAYAADKRGTVRELTLAVENSVREMLEGLEDGCQHVK